MVFFICIWTICRNEDLLYKKSYVYVTKYAIYNSIQLCVFHIIFIDYSFHSKHISLPRASDCLV